MMRLSLHLVGGLLFSFVGVGVVHAQSPARDAVEESLRELNEWLGDGENGQRWRAFLMSEALEAELAKDAPDSNALEGVLGQYHSNAEGLDRSRFAAVRRAIDAWLTSLMPPDASPLAALARESRYDFKPVTDSDLASAEAELKRTTEALDRLLNQGGTEENAKRWKEYLRWEALDTVFGVEDWSKQPRPREFFLRQISRAYFTDVSGVEHPRFRDQRRALVQLTDLGTIHNPSALNFILSNNVFYDQKEQRADLLAAATQEDQHRELAKTLAALLNQYAESGSIDDAWRIGRLLGVLDRAGRGREVIEATHDRYWRPNVFARVSERMVSAGIEDDVHETQPIHENILGTSIHGSATMNGRVRADLKHSDDVARFNLVLSGIAHSTSVGYNRSVRIFTTGVSQVNASKEVIVYANGLRSLNAVASVATNSTINGISAKHRIVQRIASRRAAQQKGQAEQIASRKAEGRTSARFDEKAAPMLADANQRLIDKFQTPLVRTSAYPRLIETSSTEDSLALRAMFVNRDQLAASAPPPPIADSRDVAAQVHESAVGNFMESMRAGQRLTAHDAQKMYVDLKRPVPEKLNMKNQDNRLWSYRFADVHPVGVKFGAGEVSINLDVYEIILWEGDIDHPELDYTKPEQGYPQRDDETRISAVYTIQNDPAGLKFVRKGEVSVEALNPRGGLDIKGRAARSVLKDAFSGMFKEEFVPEDINLPGNWEKAGKLHLRWADSRDGWLLLTWDLVPKSAADRVARTASTEITDERK